MHSEVETNPHRAVSIPLSVRAELEAQLAAGRLELPLLPGVALELTSAAGSEEVDTRTIADMLKRDAALSAHVLRIVNSPVYSPRSPIVNLQQAVSRVGALKIREIALVIACRTGVFKAKGYEAEIDAVFRHSIGTALFAQEIARNTRNNVADAFLCGLLHDVGRAVMLQAVITRLQEARLSASREAVLGFATELHERAGAALAKAWALPDTVVSTLADHHAIAMQESSVAVRIISLADRFAHLSETETSLAADAVAPHPALAALEIYPDVLEKIVQRAGAVRQTIGAWT